MGTQGYGSLPPHETLFISQQGLLVSIAPHPELRLVAHLSLSLQQSITKLPPPLTLFSFQQRTHKPTNAPHKQARAHTRAHTHTHIHLSRLFFTLLCPCFCICTKRELFSRNAHTYTIHTLRWLDKVVRTELTAHAEKTWFFYFSLSVSLCLSLRCLTQSLTQWVLVARRIVSSRTTRCFCSFCHFTLCFFLSHLFLFSLFLSSLSLSPSLTSLLLFPSFQSQSSFSRLP